MGLLECANGASVWRGYDYYNEKKVKNLTETASGVFTADVIGTASEPYVVEIDVAHPRKSTCNGPHADGKRIVCKHMVTTWSLHSTIRKAQKLSPLPKLKRHLVRIHHHSLHQPTVSAPKIGCRHC